MNTEPIDLNQMLTWLNTWRRQVDFNEPQNASINIFPPHNEIVNFVKNVIALENSPQMQTNHRPAVLEELNSMESDPQSQSLLHYELALARAHIELLTSMEKATQNLPLTHFGHVVAKIINKQNNILKEKKFNNEFIEHNRNRILRIKHAIVTNNDDTTANYLQQLKSELHGHEEQLNNFLLKPEVNSKYIESKVTNIQHIVSELETIVEYVGVSEAIKIDDAINKAKALIARAPQSLETAPIQLQHPAVESYSLESLLKDLDSRVAILKDIDNPHHGNKTNQSHAQKDNSYNKRLVASTNIIKINAILSKLEQISSHLPVVPNMSASVGAAKDIIAELEAKLPSSRPRNPIADIDPHIVANFMKKKTISPTKMQPSARPSSLFVKSLNFLLKPFIKKEKTVVKPYEANNSHPEAVPQHNRER